MRRIAALVALVVLIAFSIGRGVHNAQAQGSPTLVAIQFNGYFAIDSVGRLWRASAGEGAWEVIGQAPAGTPVTLDGTIGGLWLGMANGDIYAISGLDINPPNVVFHPQPNVFAGGVAVDQSAWGAVKRAFR